MRRPAMRLLLVAVAVAVVAALVAGLVLPPGTPHRRAASTPARPANARRSPMAHPPRVSAPPLTSLHGTPTRVTIDAGSPGSAVPGDFLGLSFEAGDLPRIAGYADRGNLVALMRSLGSGVMRFGGVSVDTRASWAPTATLPRWATTAIAARDLEGIGRLARQTGWPVLLTVGLGHADARAAASEASAARTALGSSLAGIEIGNEPDAYVSKRLRRTPWDFSRYRRQIGAYYAGIRTAVPGVLIAGPDASSGEPPLSWVISEAALERPALLTDHYYPSSSCGYTPRLSDLLSPDTRGAATGMLRRLAAISRTSAIPLRVDETNNISCGGQPGVSDTFASALWAVDYVMRGITAGVTGLNFHDLIGRPASYSPLAGRGAAALARGSLHAAPEWYALLLARYVLGDRTVRTRVAAGSRQLSAAATLSTAGRLHIVLDDFDSPGMGPLVVHLRVPKRYARGTILRLTAPSPAATTGVTLGAHMVPASGRWSPAYPLPRASGGPGALALSLAPSSAALVTLSPSR